MMVKESGGEECLGAGCPRTAGDQGKNRVGYTGSGNGALGRGSGSGTRGLGAKCAAEAAGAGPGGAGDSGQAATHRSWCRSPGRCLRLAAPAAAELQTGRATARPAPPRRAVLPPRPGSGASPLWPRPPTRNINTDAGAGPGAGRRTGTSVETRGGPSVLGSSGMIRTPPRRAHTSAGKPDSKQGRTEMRRRQTALEAEKGKEEWAKAWGRGDGQSQRASLRRRLQS